MMIQDMHLHTKYSDGLNGMEEMACIAIEQGIQEICFTDHVREYSDWIPQYLEEWEELAKTCKNQLDIKVGVEAKVIDWSGNLDIPILPKEIMIVAAIHRIPIGNGRYIRRNEIKKNREQAKICWLETILGVTTNSCVHRLAHPFSLLKELEIDEYDPIWEQLTKLFNSSDFFIEYNTKYDNSIVPVWFWKENRKKLIFGSDSHSTNEFKERINILKEIQRKGLEKNEIYIR